MIIGPHDPVTVWSWSYGYLMIWSSSDLSLDDLTTNGFIVWGTNPLVNRLFDDLHYLMMSSDDAEVKWANPPEIVRWTGHPMILEEPICGAMWPADGGDKNTTWRRCNVPVSREMTSSLALERLVRQLLSALRRCVIRTHVIPTFGANGVAPASCRLQNGIKFL